jgi:hypothetical protein
MLVPLTLLTLMAASDIQLRSDLRHGFVSL